MMRLRIQNSSHPISEHTLTQALVAGELLLASQGVTLAECFAALVADARKEPPTPALYAFHQAEAAVLREAFGSVINARGASLCLVIGSDHIPSDFPCQITQQKED